MSERNNPTETTTEALHLARMEGRCKAYRNIGEWIALASSEFINRFDKREAIKEQITELKNGEQDARAKIEALNSLLRLI